MAQAINVVTLLIFLPFFAILPILFRQRYGGQNDKKMMAWFLDQLSSADLKLAQVEAYEGQFDDPDDSSVFPPSALVMIGRSENENKDMGPQSKDQCQRVSEHQSRSWSGSRGGMLDLIDSVVELLHDKAVRYETESTPAIPATEYVGRCFWANTEPVPVYQGMSTYVVNFTVKLNRQRG